MQTTKEFAAAGDNASLVQILMSLVNIAQSSPAYIKAHMATAIDIVNTVASGPSPSRDALKLALELLVTFSESAGGTVRAHGTAVIETAVGMAIRLMQCSDDDADWVNDDFDLEGDADPSDPGPGRQRFLA